MGKPLRVDGRVVGEIVDEHYNTESFFSTHRKPAHFFKKYNGFGFSESIIAELLERKVKHIRLIYEGGRRTKVYVITPEHVMLRGKTYTHDGDTQYVVPVKDFDKVIE